MAASFFASRFKDEPGCAIALPNNPGATLDAQGRLNQQDKLRQFAADEVFNASPALAQILDGDGEFFAIGKHKRALPVHGLTVRARDADFRREG